MADQILTPLRTGINLLPLSVAFLVASLAAGRLVPRYGAWVLTVGSVLAAAGYLLVGRSGAEDVVAQMGLLGVGLGLVMPPLMGIVLSQVHGHMAGLGSGLLITTQQAALGLGSAVVGSIFLAQHVAPASAYERTTLVLAGSMLVIAALTRLLEPRRR